LRCGGNWILFHSTTRFISIESAISISKYLFVLLFFFFGAISVLILAAFSPRWSRSHLVGRLYACRLFSSPTASIHIRSKLHDYRGFRNFRIRQLLAGSYTISTIMEIEVQISCPRIAQGTLAIRPSPGNTTCTFFLYVNTTFRSTCAWF
jgi:hypothetical protein